MSEWKPYPIEAIGKIVTGKTPPSRVTDAFLEVGVPFVTPRDMDGRRWISSTERYLSEDGVQAVKNSLVPANSVAVSCIGSDMGKAVLLVSESVTNQQINTIIVNEDLFNPKFIYYVLSTKQQELKDISGGSATPILNKGHFGKFEILAPQKPCQDLIVEQLDSLDSKIELNRQTNQTLEHIAQAIFKSWFVDFEPTRAKAQVRASVAEGRMPGSDQNLPPGFSKDDEERLVERAAMAAISGKSLDELDQLTPEQQEQLLTAAALFPDALVDAAHGSANAAGGRMPRAAQELGEIPEGWEWSEIGNEVAVVGGGTPSTNNEEYWEGGRINWTSPKDMSNLTDKILLETDRKITEAGLAKISSGLLPENTVLMSSRAPVGYLAISKIPVAVNQGYIAMKCEGRLSPEYVVQWADSIMDDIKQRASGTTFAEISKKNFKIIPVIVPSSEAIDEFSNIVGGIYNNISEYLNQINTLTEARDTLLPKLLSGEISLQAEA